MAQNITVASNSSSNQDYVQSLTNFKHDIFESLDTSLLSFETDLQHLLALSNILFIRKYSYHPNLRIILLNQYVTFVKTYMILLAMIVLSISSQKILCWISSWLSIISTVGWSTNRLPTIKCRTSLTNKRTTLLSSYYQIN